MKIAFTRHSLNKFKIFKRHQLVLNKKNIISVIENPDHIDKEIDYPKIIVSKELGKKHVLRVVYRVGDGIITIITFYPAEKGRYY